MLTEEQAATPETAESARLSLTVLDSDYSGFKNGNIDESLFYTKPIMLRLQLVRSSRFCCRWMDLHRAAV